ncbi:MAG: sulfotransferase [Anaerolineae bacterium]
MFSFRNFFKFAYLTLFRKRKDPREPIPRRIGGFVLFYLLFFLLEIVTWFGFLMDEIFFRGYKKKKVWQPIFVVGNPRSGTTFLHRLLARDETNFAFMRTWEMVFAPSITLRRVLKGLRAADRALGSPMQRLIDAQQRRWQGRNVMHKIALQAPEEDEYLLFHIWSSLKIWLYVALLDEAIPYTYFDMAMPEEEKERIMTFYKSCLQRHLYAAGTQRKHYLSKNPSFTPMIDTLYDYFPDAKIIYLARNPLDMIPSFMSLKEREWEILDQPIKDERSREYVLNMAHHWYSYPLKRLERVPEEDYVIVNFDDLVKKAESTVARIYKRFGLQMGPDFARVLHEEGERARNYDSDHEYSLEEMGLTHDEIVKEYRGIFSRFGFDTRGEAVNVEADSRAKKK